MRFRLSPLSRSMSMETAPAIRLADKARFETKSWNKTCGSKGFGKKYAARLSRIAGKALCREVTE